MNEDPTIPIGVAHTGGAARADSPGSAVWGSFTLLARVGFGGFGEVYRAWDPHLQREVALKLLLPGAVGGDADYQAMLREARALASVRHPNIVPVHGIDRHDGRVGFWTDFVRGKTLSVLVGEQGTFGAREAALIGLDVARALSAVHRAGLLHRDIKAENVMREEGGRILLMDFGLSALEHRQTNIAGTPNYMAPELFEGGHCTVATDIYALGVLLFFLVAGDYPVHLGGLTTLEALQAFPERKPLMDLRPDLPESLLRTVGTAMDMDPAKRFTSAGQLANALAESLGTHAPVEISVAPEPRSAIKAGKRWIFAGLLTAAVIGAASLIWFGARSKSADHANASEPTPPAAVSDAFGDAQKKLLRSYNEADLAEAVKGFQAVVKADPTNALAVARLGEAYFAQHGYNPDPKLLDLAWETSQHAVTLNAELAAPYVTLARLAAAQGDTQLATQTIQKALQFEPRSAEVHGARGEIFEAQHRDQEAISEYQQSITLAPDDWRWPMSLGVAEWKQGNRTGAISQWQQAATLAPDNAVAFYNLSLAHHQSGQLDEARKDLERSIDLDPTSKKYAALGSLLLFEGKFDQSAAMELKAIALNPKSYEAYSDLGAAYLWSGTNHDKAVQAYNKAIELEEAARAHSPQKPEFLATLADHYSAVGNRDKSLLLARQALAIAPDDPTVEFMTGEAFELSGQRDAAIPLVEKALASGYYGYEFEHSPEFASLRRDPKFTATLNQLKQRKQ